jgi:hypothetical protein
MVYIIIIQDHSHKNWDFLSEEGMGKGEEDGKLFR